MLRIDERGQDPAQLHTIDADTGAAIIAAGLLTVVLFPPLALMLLSRSKDGSKSDTSKPGAGDTQ
jgi:hypothetical protein